MVVPKKRDQVKITKKVVSLPKTVKEESKPVKTDRNDHKKQLESLKTQDPDFYNFLKEQDADLLNFEMPDVDDDGDADEDLQNSEDHEESGDSDEDESEVEEPDDQGEFHAASSSEESDISGDEENKLKSVHKEVKSHIKETQTVEKKTKVLTAEMLETWVQRIKTGHFSTIKKVIITLHHIAKENFVVSETESKNVEETMTKTRQGFTKIVKPQKKEKKASKSQFKCSRTVTNQLLAVSFQQLSAKLSQIFKVTRGKKDNKIALNEKKWKKYKTLLRMYFSSLLSILQCLNNPKSVSPLLSTCLALSHLILKLPDLARDIIKVLVSFLRTPDEEFRISVSLLLRQWLNESSRFTPVVLKRIHEMYLEYSKPSIFDIEAHRLSTTFLTKTIVQIVNISPNESLTIVHSSIRNLASKVRNCLIQKTEETRSKVINWRFVSSLHLWCHVLSNIEISPAYRQLIHAVAQITLSAMKAFLVPRYYPFHVNCMRSLLHLMRSTDVYIPLGLIIIQMLCDPFMLKESKPSTHKPFLFKYRLYTSKGLICTEVYRKCASEELCDLYLEYISLYSHSISFPEISYPLTLIIGKSVKEEDRGKDFHKYALLKILDKMQKNSKFITDKRKSVKFSPIDLDQVKAWERELLAKSGAILPILTYFNATRKVRDQFINQMEKSGECEMQEDEENDDNDHDDINMNKNETLVDSD